MKVRSLRHRVRGLVMASALLLVAMPGPSRAMNFDEATVPELQAAMTAGTLTAEQLVKMCLARIDAYDHKGPALRAILTINPKALETARSLDAERKAKGPRSALHGIPVILKDNFDTVDMPTTGGSLLLEGSIPKADAFVVKKLRDAGAIILGKANMSEFASGGSQSSMGGLTLNPHDLERSTSGSSSGTGASMAAGYAPLGFGSDTLGSIRGPSFNNGIVGLKPTTGLLSRNGIIPLALTFDTGGPMARSITDIAAVLGPITGVDPGDALTKTSAGKAQTDYLKTLRSDVLKGLRIGVARDGMGRDADVDWVVDAGLEQMRQAGATIVDVRLPKWFLDNNVDWYFTMRYREFAVQIGDYLKTLGPQYPKSLQDMIDRSQKIVNFRPDGAGPNTVRWSMFKREAASGSLQDYQYTALHDYALPMVKRVVDGAFAEQKLDVIVYPTSATRAALVHNEAAPGPASSGYGLSALANFTGYPDLSVPAGFTGDQLPIDISFLGPAYSEAKLLSIGYSFEKLTHARRRPVHTPPLKDEEIAAH